MPAPSAARPATAQRSPRLVDRHPLALFLLLAFALSWWTWPLTALNPTSVALVPIGPSLAALVLTAWAGGWTATRALLGQLVRWRVHPRWYAATLLPVAIITLAAFANLRLGAPAPPTSTYADWYTLPLAIPARLLVGGALGEELGWRGWLLPRLQATHRALAASLLVGAVWGAWHLPLLVSDPTRQRPAAQFLVWVLAMSVLHTWLYNSTNGSLLITMLFHGAIDATAAFFFPLFSGADYQRVWWLACALTWLLAITVILRAGSRHLTHQQRATA